ncbi:hypothetical protein VCR3J2_40158 [Vibrio coralliirubri]|nr:hypothetical protein VCR3J2_40158 [Vibrio coralliirubri]
MSTKRNIPNIENKNIKSKVKFSLTLGLIIKKYTSAPEINSHARVKGNKYANGWFFPVIQIDKNRLIAPININEDISFFSPKNRKERVKNKG